MEKRDISEAAIPDWMKPLLPEMEYPAVLTVVDDKYLLTYPDGSTIHIKELEDLHAATNGFDLEFGADVYRKSGSEKDYGFISYPTGNGFSGMLMSHTDVDRLATLERDYANWLEIYSSYKENPSDFYSAYYFVDRHPAFWMTMGALPSWHWETGSHCSRIYQYVGKDEENNNELYVALETGSHVEDDYKTHYHDYRLDAYGSTFENAFIELAARLDYFYNEDGSQVTPEPEFVKPAWVEELESRITDAEEARSNDSNS